MMLSALLSTLVGLGVKLLKHISNLEINFFKALVGMLICYGVSRYKQPSIWGSNHRLLLVRGITGAVGIILFFITLQYLPLAIANLIQGTTPIFTTILGFFMLKQPIGVKQGLCFAMAMAGLVLINGFDTAVAPSYVFIGLMGALAMGIANILNSMLKGKEGPIVIVFYMSLFTVLGTGGSLLYDFTMLQLQDVLILVAIGILALLADFLAIQAYQLAAVAPVSTVAYLGVPYSLALGFIFLRETYSWISLLGMGLVLLGALLSLLYK